MSARLRIQVLEDRQLRETAEFDGPVELGRQRETTELLYGQRKDQGVERWVIARRDETMVSRRHVLLKPLREGRIWVTNISDMQPVRMTDQSELQPGEWCEATLPILILLGPTRSIRVEQAVASSQLLSLAEATLPPRGRVKSVPALSVLLESGDRIPAREVIRWLHVAMEVLQAAADSDDFFDCATRAVIETVGLDSARVLLHEEGAWRTRATQTAGDSGLEAVRPASTSVLDRVLKDRRTTWEIPGTDRAPSESLLGLESVVAAPILDRSGAVIGALYGERLGMEHATGQPMGELEAMMVELLARGVAAGLARVEEERRALTTRTQFEQYFTPDLARQLLSQPDLLDGRDREVTLFFCDIRGFSRISLALGAERTIGWCRDVLDNLSECVLAEGGVLVDYVGDGLMALWGAPHDQPDHAQRACRAALAIGERLPALDARWREMLGEPMDLGIGIHTGTAQVGNVGSRHKFKYGAMGPTVNLASRLQGATKVFKTRILLGGETFRQLGGSLPGRRLGRIRVVGIPDDVDLYELLESAEPNATAAREEYERALAEFEQGEFALAARSLGNWRARCPDDGPALVLLFRAVQALVEGIPPRHPVWELKVK